MNVYDGSIYRWTGEQTKQLPISLHGYGSRIQSPNLHRLCLVGSFNHLIKNMKVNGKDYPIYYGK